jgi:hypothetical protein
MDADLQAVAPDMVGGPRARTKLLGKLSTMRRTVDQAGEPGSRKAKRKFKTAGRQLQQFIGTVAKGQRKQKIKEPIASRLLTTADATKQQLLPLQR